jgi:uncharacterized membrane protein YphA (DoxX/SURF4 family)
MIDRRRQLSAFAVLALVLMRLAIGWHFFSEGSSKLYYDRSSGELRLAFSAEPFLAEAKGPLAQWFQSIASSEHEWRTLLASPHQDKPLTKDEEAADLKWRAEYEERKAAAVRDEKPAPLEFSPLSPYYDWATQIVDDWRSILGRFNAISMLSDEQRLSAAKALAARGHQLSDYLTQEAEAIADYRHDVWRLQTMRTAPEAAGVPFVKRRAATLQASTTQAPFIWIGQVAALDREYLNDLRQIVPPEQRNDSNIGSAVENALALPSDAAPGFLNWAVPVMLIGVGIFLMIGLITRLAASVGGLFVMAVIAAHPPWIGGSAPTYNQVIELSGMLVLAATGAGRWAGLDYFGYVLVARLRRREERPQTS